MHASVSTSRRRLLGCFLLGLLSCSFNAHPTNWSTDPTVNPYCNVSSYYYGLLQRDLTTWTRDDLEDLVRETHTNLVPFYGSDDDSGNGGDVLAALLQLDQIGATTEKETILLFYSHQEVPQYPLDRSIWVPENVCALFMTDDMETNPNDFDWAYSDLHNIRPVHPLIHESERGTRYFGVCSVCIELFAKGSNTCVCGDFFQPPDIDKGVVARAWLYMQLRYPDLYISNCHLEQLLAWHMLHPPSVDERLRNEAICSAWQGNRNPFVDFPDLATKIRIHETPCYDSENLEGMTASGSVFQLLPGNSANGRDEDLTYGRVIDIDDPTKGESAFTGDSLKDYDAGVLETLMDTMDNIASEDGCAQLIAGDIFFYVVQSIPTRIGFLPLVDLPVGLGLYLTTSLPVDDDALAVIQFEAGIPDAPLVHLVLKEPVIQGSPFGYGPDLLFGDQWEVLTQGVTIGGEFGGNEMFLLCNEQSDSQPHMISAITMGGQFREPNYPLLQGAIGVVVLPTPMDYYVYDGPYFTSEGDYQRALMNAENWLGIDLGGLDNAALAFKQEQNRPRSESAGQVLVWIAPSMLLAATLFPIFT
jgi:endonuclease I